MTAAKRSTLAADADLPEGWVNVRLREAVTNLKGKKPNQVGDENWAGAVPYIDIQTFESGVPSRFADKHSAVLIERGDVLVVWDGARSGLVGKAPTDGALGSTLTKLGPLFAERDYLEAFLRTCFDEINSNPRGTGIPHVDPELFWNLELPVAPLAEQKRIVEKVEQLLARVNAARERLARVPAILKRFRQAVLAAACSGRLTADWRDQHPGLEPASKLLLDIEKFRSERAGKYRKPARDASTSVEPAEDQDKTSVQELPELWAWCSVDQIATVCLGGTPSRKKQSYWNGDVPWVSSGEVANCRISTTRERITREGLANSNAKIYPRGTVLIAMIGEGKTRGQAAILDIDACTNQNVAGLAFDAGSMVPDFVWLWAQSEYERNRAAGRGGAQPALNGEKVRALTLSLPPLEEQREIVRRVEALFKLADTIEKRVTAGTARAEKLTQAFLAKAFRGKLVPTEAELARREGRSYEPASALLSRIKAQHARVERTGIASRSPRPPSARRSGRKNERKDMV